MAMRKYFPFVILCLLAFLPIGTVSAENAAPASPDEVISLINQYRQQNGIAPLAYNSLLASLAQQQSNYQAQISSITHTGAGGTTPQQRAEAAGYGGGSWFYLSEIIYGGSTATPNSALTWWKNSGLHNSIMLDAKYTQIGAGVATDGSYTYFTAELGGPTGGNGSGSTSPTSTQSAPGTKPEPTSEPVPVVIPVSRSTPNPDGSTHHIVQQGQSLWTIAAIYDTTPEKIIKLNGMESSYIFPGDDLIIKLASDQPAATLELSNPPSPTPTLDPASNVDSKTSPSSSPVSAEIKPMLGTPFSMVVEQNTVTPEPTSPPARSLVPDGDNEPPNFLSSNPIVSTLVIAAVVILVLVVLASGFLQIKPGRPSRDDLVK